LGWWPAGPGDIVNLHGLSSTRLEEAIVEKLKSRPIEIQGTAGKVRLSRNEYGIPLIQPEKFIDIFYGLGWVHAFDRGVELELTRLVAKGTIAEHLEASDELIATDIGMRRWNMWGISQEQVDHLTPEAREITEAYCRGVNEVTAAGRPFEFRLVGHKPETYTPADCIMMTKLIGLVDLTETQGWAEKLIMQMLQHGASLEMLRELFPYLTDEPDPEFLDILKQVKLNETIVPETVGWNALPRMIASNNWAVSGERSASGKPIMCGDPHLDTARLPAIWQEVMIRTEDPEPFWFAGCTVPGIPIMALGRTNHIAWSPTYGYMDNIDFFVEEVKGGRYRRGEEWLDFEVREETVKLKKGEPRKVRFYENEHGVLDGDPSEDGYYLCMAFSLGKGTGAGTLNHGKGIVTARNVTEALPHFAALDFSSQNWVCADSEGNIGYYQSGLVPVRAEGCSGLLPMPGWDPAYDWKGTHPVEKNPNLYNPPEGIINTSNQDMNYCADVGVCSLPMGDWRSRYIHELLAARTDHTPASMQKMHYDVYSKHAEDWMPIIKPLLPEGKSRAETLRSWDMRYSSDSLGASIFENIYLQFARLVFGEQSLGSDVMAFVMDESILFADFTGSFDAVMLREESAWFGGKKRDELLRVAIERGLAREARPWGETRKVMMNNIMFAGRFPNWLGFDYGPIEIIGGRATIPQGQIFNTQGRMATFSPTYKFVTDFAEDCIYSATAGGPSDRRFSKWYTSGIADWVAGKYRKMSPKG
jgi:penicillin amidase